MEKKPKKISQSQKIRFLLFEIWKKEKKPGEFEQYYQNFTGNIIDNLEKKLLTYEPIPSSETTKANTT